ncbi:MAG: hypothetical protein A2381_02700 [Bdellovibrionales bacterium RIFOXYB1_FULL_37_110]|nr:MAG: hypothetical protein A2181_05080 [Bdellovibrionales bacterium RIFOXYA1_FULL_38_20]OFZ52607.1 MAG: hypothetical protein A2417_01035 [Bdellovibrionales bacterium RIFOXYC1_FULL_37_79]OFZ58297.1 MAG: hypothetical protein A2381_02700 [Bdellovibrionales bacterium RIFOXYB1_FULL_37_110]OFZ65284.1 MAG: hypothetical protein A2577_04015 [Bdellovibrionales bacterium RIFOXYD1_FULL_36_51]
MKFLFKVFLFTILTSHMVCAREIIVVTYNSHQDLALLTREILMNHFIIPKKLITLKQTLDPCQKIDNPIMHLCVNEQRELLLVELKKEIVTKSFGVFLLTTNK